MIRILRIYFYFGAQKFVLLIDFFFFFFGAGIALKCQVICFLKAKYILVNICISFMGKWDASFRKTDVKMCFRFFWQMY